LVARFRTGHFGTEDEERSGRQTQVTITENVDAIHSLTEAATLTVYGWFATQPKEFFLDGSKKSEKQSHKCGAQGGICRVNTFIFSIL
jgi:hypothetical protein